jgi:hypothetical protein
MSLTNEQRAHDVALKFTELKFKQTGESSKFSFYETYLVAYEEILKKLNS